MTRSRRDFGMIRKLPSGRYQASYLAPDGTRRNAPHTFAGKTEAGAWLAKTRTSLEEHSWHDPRSGQLTLAEWVEVYVTTNRRIKAEGTRQLIRRDARLWILAPLEVGKDRIHLAEIPIGKINEALVDRWYMLMRHLTREAAVKKASASTYRGHPARWWAQSRGMEVNDRGRLSPAVVAAWEKAGKPGPPPRAVPPHAGHDTAARIYRTLHALMEFAAAKKRIPANPVNIPGAGEDATIDRLPVEPHEVETMAEAFTARYRAALWFAVYTALRAGQTFALRRRDIDFEHARIRVARSQREPEQGPIVYDAPKTEGTSRWVPMHTALAAILRDHLDEFVPEDADALVFATRTGKPLRAGNRSHMFDRARQAAGRPDVRWHDLRAVAPNAAADRGANTKDLMGILDHSTPDAAQRYLRTSEQRRKRILLEVGDLFAGPPPISPVNDDRPEPPHLAAA